MAGGDNSHGEKASKGKATPQMPRHFIHSSATGNERKSALNYHRVLGKYGKDNHIGHDAMVGNYVGIFWTSYGQERIN